MTELFECYRRDDHAWRLTFKDSDGDAVDLTGDTIFLTVKEDVSDTDDNALIKKDVTSHTDAENGITAISLSNSDTDVAAGDYYFDIQRKHDSSITTIMSGTFRVKQDITIRTS
jgi:hypothetical protein